MQPEEIFLEHLRTIERIAGHVCRRNHLSPDDSAEFTQEVNLRLIEHEYAVIRKFEGRSLFSTYLTTVIPRLFHQWRVEQWGKWRPSAEAKRLGDKAITLERLITRDGFTFHEAVQILTTPSGAGFTKPQLEAIYVRLPARQPRPVMVSDEVSPDAVATTAEADDRIEADGRHATACTAARIIDRTMESMPAEDQLILQMRFWESRKVPDIAQRLNLDQKKLYKRLDKLCASLRRALEEAGINRRDIDSLLAIGDQELHFTPQPTGAGKPHFGPSHRTSGETVKGGKGRLR
jgi:RNA polymerase sigma factor for flagellar operon FliA